MLKYHTVFAQIKEENEDQNAAAKQGKELFLRLHSELDAKRVAGLKEAEHNKQRVHLISAFKEFARQIKKPEIAQVAVPSFSNLDELASYAKTVSSIIKKTFPKPVEKLVNEKSAQRDAIILDEIGPFIDEQTQTVRANELLGHLRAKYPDIKLPINTLRNLISKFRSEGKLNDRTPFTRQVVFDPKIEEHMPAAKKIIRKVAKSLLDDDIALNIARRHIRNALRTYDPTQGKLISFISSNLHRQLRQYLREKTVKMLKTPFTNSLDHLDQDEHLQASLLAPEVESEVDPELVSKTAESLVKHLGGKNKLNHTRVLMWMLHYNHGHSLAEIAHHYLTGRELVRQNITHVDEFIAKKLKTRLKDLD